MDFFPSFFKILDDNAYERGRSLGLIQEAERRLFFFFLRYLATTISSTWYLHF